MVVTASGLTKAAGAAAVVAGTIFVAVQIGHPASGTFTTETSQWVARSIAKAAMAVLALAGISGMYLRTFRQSKLLGLTGYVLFATGYLAMFGVEVIAATVLPNLSGSESAFVDDVIAAATGGTPASDIGGLATLFAIAGAAYLAGGLLFGIALFRTRILARWAAALLAVSTVATAALAVLPEAFNRPLAVPEGIAMIGLGVSLWRQHRESSVVPTGSPAEPALGRAAS